MEVDCIKEFKVEGYGYSVLILVVMEVDCILNNPKTLRALVCLNPCCDGSRLYGLSEKEIKSSRRS